MPNAAVVHLELHTGDREEAEALLESVCGWTPETIEAGARPYRAIDMGGGLGGGIVECSTQRSLWLPYVEVEGIEAATERARRRGALVLLEPREGPAGWRSVIATAAGAELALWQQKG
jgi:predicted enzyme related to lactoylglutathione lyase